VRLAAFFGLLLLLAMPARAQQIDSIEIVDYGIYSAHTQQQWRGPDGLLRNNWVDICHVATTTKVPARLQLILGLRYRIKGEQEGEFAELQVITIFPSPIKPPGNAQPIGRFESNGPREIGETHFAAYAFDEPAELVTGRWTIEIWHRGRKRLEEAFDVVADDGVRLPGGGGSGGGSGGCFKAS
jgi:hypothetical protein